MDRQTALGRLLVSADRSWWPSVPGLPMPDDELALYTAAMASLSGFLSECETDADIRAAVESFARDAADWTPEQLASEVDAIQAELLEWGKRVDAAGAVVRSPLVG